MSDVNQAPTDPVLAYISGQERLVIQEANNSAVTINGFTLGNAGDANDSTTALTVSIAAAGGTLKLGTATGITFSTGTNDGTAETLVFKGTIADLRTAINTLTYDPKDDNLTDDPLEIKISSDDGTTWQPYTVGVPGKFYYPFNGHYYEYVTVGAHINWNDAKAAAEARELYGLRGYLVTVTSQNEQDFIQPKLLVNGWMGASDAAIEGDWRWVTGPEGQANGGAGTPFWTGSSKGFAVNGSYTNWATNEPNNGGGGGEQDWGQFYASGKWDDNFFNSWANPVTAYIVEYGGNGSDALGTLTTAKLTIVVNQPPVVDGLARIFHRSPPRRLFCHFDA